VSAPLGRPRLHLRETDSTNLRARELALAGTPHGTVVTAGAQSAGRGRQGRTWTAPPGRALLMSLVLRDPPPMLPLIAAVAVADACWQAPGEVRIKWPNDVLLDGRKVAGILVEGRPQERWAVVGIGLNVAVRAEDFPDELRDRATGLGREPADVERALRDVLRALERRLGEQPGETLAAWRERDALAGREISWNGGGGVAAGVDDDGRLLVDVAGGEQVALDAGEVHLGTVVPPGLST
jgi:BirA family biotin operon repressor/biotin-[acetyl-CoA-carboxylase] ligase